MDYVNDEVYKKLSVRARIMFSVVEHAKANQDKELCLKNQFFHSINKLANLADLSRPHAVYALKELEQKGIITREHRHGHSTLYTYIPAENNDLMVTLRNLPKVTLRNLPTVTPCNHITTVPEQIQLTTTEWLSPQLHDQLIRQYGESAVNDRVVVIDKMNGKVKNKAGLLRQSLREGYIPTSKEYRDEEAEEKRHNLIDEQMEKARLEREQWEYNPEMPKKAIAEFLAKLEKAEEEKRITV